MSTRTISDRELLLETARRAAELAEQVADLHTRIERVAVLAGVDTGLGSRSVASETEHTPLTTARLCEYLERTGRLQAAPVYDPTNHAHRLQAVSRRLDEAETTVIRCLLGHEHADAGEAVDCNREQAERERARGDALAFDRTVRES